MAASSGQRWWSSLTDAQRADYILRKQQDKAQVSTRMRGPGRQLPEPAHGTVYYTDGSADPNPGPGGFAAVLGGVLAAHGGELRSTNQRMEGMAILSALRHADGRPCEIRTDSQFWVNVLTRWAAGWEQRGWRKGDGKPVANLDIVRAAVAAFASGTAQVAWVPGHAGEPGNEAADCHAGAARERTLASGRQTWAEFPLAAARAL